MRLWTVETLLTGLSLSAGLRLVVRRPKESIGCIKNESVRKMRCGKQNLIQGSGE